MAMSCSFWSLDYCAILKSERSKIHVPTEWWRCAVLPIINEDCGAGGMVPLRKRLCCYSFIFFPALLLQKYVIILKAQTRQKQSIHTRFKPISESDVKEIHA